MYNWLPVLRLVYDYSFSIETVEYTWRKFHTRGPGSCDESVSLSIVIQMDEPTAPAFFPAARAKVIGDVLGKDACLSLAAQGARFKKDVAVAMVSGMTYHGSEEHEK